MAEITTDLIKRLRETSGAGMMDCKKALAENDGDFDASVDWLRKKGLAAAAKKAGRVAAEGLVVVAVEGNKGAVAEVNSETDFVAKNEIFQTLASNIAKIALSVDGNFEALKEKTCPDTGKKVDEVIAEHIGTIGENIQLRRTDGISVGEGIVASYIHNQVLPGMGKIGVLVGIESSGDAEKLRQLGKQIAMHIAAAKPESLDVDSLDPTLIERERNVLTEQARASGKPEEIIEKMIDGRIRKYYEEVVLLEQLFVIDGKTKVSKVVEDAANDIGSPVKLTGFIRFNLGEGIEKKEEDFAAEVAATAAGN